MVVVLLFAVLLLVICLLCKWIERCTNSVGEVCVYVCVCASNRNLGVFVCSAP